MALGIFEFFKTGNASASVVAHLDLHRKLSIFHEILSGEGGMIPGHPGATNFLAYFFHLAIVEIGN